MHNAMKILYSSYFSCKVLLFTIEGHTKSHTFYAFKKPYVELNKFRVFLNFTSA